MCRNDEIIWDFYRNIVALPADEFAVFCKHFNDARLPVWCSGQIIEKASNKRNLRNK